MVTCVVETLDGTRLYIREGDSLITANGERLTYHDLLYHISAGDLEKYGLKGAAPLPILVNVESGSRRTLTRRRSFLTVAAL